MEPATSALPSTLLDRAADVEVLTPEEVYEQDAIRRLATDARRLGQYADNLDALTKQDDAKTLNAKASLAARSVQAHKVLLERLDAKMKRSRLDNMLGNTIGQIIHMVDECMMAQQIDPETREVLLQNLMLKIEQAQLEEKLDRRLGLKD